MSVLRAPTSGPVAAWLFVLAAMVASMVLLGGLVRVTGSGLSIVRWDLVTGILPPLSAADWEAAFRDYQASPEYRLVNSWMGLEDFRRIFWWEWAHRMLGRSLGVAFVLPLVVFWWTGRIAPVWRARLALLLLLGALQGMIGWLMVRSGLIDEPRVSPYLLATHLLLAFILFGLLLDLAQKAWLSPKPGRAPWIAWLLLALIMVQIVYGAFVAGAHAGLVYNDWPLMDGGFLPPPPIALEPAWRSFFEDPGTAQFLHRTIAYGILALSIALAWLSRDRLAMLLCLLIFGQAALGIVTLINVTPPGLAIGHQFGAVAVFAAATLLLGRLRVSSQRRASASDPLSRPETLGKTSL